MDRAGQVDHPDVDGFSGPRRHVLARLGWGGAGIAARGLLGGTVGALFAGLAAPPAGADTALDVQILQTASSVARLAADMYDVVLTSGSVPDRALDTLSPAAARDALVAILSTTRKQHGDQLRAFQARTTALGGVAQDAPNPRFGPAMAQQVGGLADPQKVVDFAVALEKLATDTYLTDLTMLQDRPAKELVAGAMAVVAQHLATFRALGALLSSPQLIALPFPQAGILALPGAVCARAFPDAIHQLNGPEGVADPSSGAAR